MGTGTHPWFAVFKAVVVPPAATLLAKLRLTARYICCLASFCEWYDMVESMAKVDRVRGRDSQSQRDRVRFRGTGIQSQN